jgi:hypothetical protein
MKDGNRLAGSRGGKVGRTFSEVGFVIKEPQSITITILALDTRLG